MTNYIKIENVISDMCGIISEGFGGISGIRQRAVGGGQFVTLMIFVLS